MRIALLGGTKREYRDAIKHAFDAALQSTHGWPKR